MKILGLGVPELLIILAVALLIFGPKHLPKLGRSLGRTIHNFREGLGNDKDVVKEAEEEEAPKRKKKAAAKKLEVLRMRLLRKKLRLKSLPLMSPRRSLPNLQTPSS